MEKKYIREDAIEYARTWAFLRNPKYYNYDKLGGDCTNFISQCIYAGSKVMNYTNTFGWYYRNANDKSASWTGVEYLYNFLTRKKENIGPIGKETSRNYIEIGDVIQLSFDGIKFTHSLIVTNIINSDIFISSHTDDSFDRNLKSYNYNKARFIHIEKVIY